MLCSTGFPAVNGLTAWVVICHRGEHGSHERERRSGAERGVRVPHPFRNYPTFLVRHCLDFDVRRKYCIERVAVDSLGLMATNGQPRQAL